MVVDGSGNCSWCPSQGCSLLVSPSWDSHAVPRPCSEPSSDILPVLLGVHSFTPTTRGWRAWAPVLPGVRGGGEPAAQGDTGHHPEKGGQTCTRVWMVWATPHILGACSSGCLSGWETLHGADCPACSEMTAVPWSRGHAADVGDTRCSFSGSATFQLCELGQLPSPF